MSLTSSKFSIMMILNKAICSDHGDYRNMDIVPIGVL